MLILDQNDFYQPYNHNDHVFELILIAILTQQNEKAMSYTQSFQLVNRYRRLMKTVSFYEHQIDVLHKMLNEFSQRYMTIGGESEFFHRAFDEKQMLINGLKNHLNSNNYLVSKAINDGADSLSPVLVEENELLEKDVMRFEREVNELSREFKDFLLYKV